MRRNGPARPTFPDHLRVAAKAVSASSRCWRSRFPDRPKGARDERRAAWRTMWSPSRRPCGPSPGRSAATARTPTTWCRTRLIKAWSNREKFEPGTNLQRLALHHLPQHLLHGGVRRRRELIRPRRQACGVAVRSGDPGMDAGHADPAGGAAQLPIEHRGGPDLVGAAGLSLRGGGRHLQLRGRHHQEPGEPGAGEGWSGYRWTRARRRTPWASKTPVRVSVQSRALDGADIAAVPGRLPTPWRDAPAGRASVRRPV